MSETLTSNGKVTCPVCRSVIAADGGTVFERSPQVAKLEKELAAYREKLPQLQARIEALKGEVKDEREPKGKKGSRRLESRPERRNAGERKPDPPAGLSGLALRRWREQHDA